MRRVAALSSRMRHVTSLKPFAATARQSLFVALLLLCLSQLASAQTTIYHIRGNAGGNNNIWAINPTTGAETRIYTNYLGGNAATIAQRPSDGMIFFSINATNGAVYRYNPATPSAAPVAIGNLGPTALGQNVSGGFRMAFNGNTLYYMVGNAGTDANVVYTVDQNNGRATRLATVTGTNNGGDIAFSGNVLYIVDQDRRLCTYAGLPANGAASGCATITMSGSPNTIGIAFDGTGRLLMQTVHSTNGGQFWSVSGGSGSLISSLSGGGSATGDLASAAVPAPDISVTKTDGVTQTYQGATLTYTIVVTNNSAYTVDANLIDNVPASLTGVSWTCTATAGSTCDAASGSGNSINTGARLAASGTATYLVTATVNVSSGSIANTATVTLDATWLTESNTTNNSQTDTDTVVAAANIAITKTATSTFAVDNNATYRLRVSNAGPQSAAGPITVTDTLPAGLAFFSGGGGASGWTCSALGAAVTCQHAGPILSGQTLPDITLTVSVTAPAAPSVTNTANVSSPTFDPSTTNNSSTATTNVLYIRLQKSYVVNGLNPRPGTDITYTVAFDNLGGAQVSNLVIVDMVPYNTDYKVGTAAYTYPPIVPVIQFSNAARDPSTPPQPPSPFTLYTPTGTYDPLATWVRWTFTGNIPVGASGSVTFTVRIR